MPFKSSKWYPVLENIQAISGSGNPNLHRNKKTLSITDNGIGMTQRR